METARGWIPVLVAVLVQTAGIVYWASTIAAKVHELDMETERQKQVIAQNADRLTKVQTIQEQMIQVIKPYDHGGNP